MLEQFITPENPLGPSRHELMGQDIESARSLLTSVAPFRQVFEERSSMIIGRRGSGKTAIMLGYRALADTGYAAGDELLRSKPLSFGSRRARKTRPDLQISVVEWGHYHELVRKVARRAALDVDFPGGEAFITPERTAELWADAYWDLVFQKIYELQAKDSRYKKSVPAVVKLFEEEKIGDIYVSDKQKYIDYQFIEEDIEKAKEEVFNFLNQYDLNCYILIDSVEEYPVKNSMYKSVLAGFLKSISDFHYKHPRIRVIFSLPSELYRHFDDGSSNLIKDFGGASRLNWKPSDLLELVATRYRLGLLTLQNGLEEEHREALEQRDFAKSEDRADFFDFVLESTVENGLGHAEDTLAYLIRHTQLLPREFIVYFNAAIRKSKQELGTYRWIPARIIKQAVEEQETQLAKQALKPFQGLYSDVIEACRSILPELPPICTLGDLDIIKARFKGHISEENRINLHNILFDMGIIGWIDDNTKETAESDRYVYAFFQYNSVRNISFNNSTRYCVHPQFSKRFGMSRARCEEKRCVYPANIEHIRMRR